MDEREFGVLWLCQDVVPKEGRVVTVEKPLSYGCKAPVLMPSQSGLCRLV